MYGGQGNPCSSHACFVSLVSAACLYLPTCLHRHLSSYTYNRDSTYPEAFPSPSNIRGCLSMFMHDSFRDSLPGPMLPCPSFT